MTKGGPCACSSPAQWGWGAVSKKRSPPPWGPRRHWGPLVQTASPAAVSFQNLPGLSLDSQCCIGAWAAWGGLCSENQRLGTCCAPAAQKAGHPCPSWGCCRGIRLASWELGLEPPLVPALTPSPPTPTPSPQPPFWVLSLGSLPVCCPRGMGARSLVPSHLPQTHCDHIPPLPHLLKSLPLPGGAPQLPQGVQAGRGSRPSLWEQLALSLGCASVT